MSVCAVGTSMYTKLNVRVMVYLSIIALSLINAHVMKIPGPRMEI